MQNDSNEIKKKLYWIFLNKKYCTILNNQNTMMEMGEN